ncbi:MAG: methyl-accepting chemotaxis protein, partial [Terracidiphilus sp.]
SGYLPHLSRMSAQLKQTSKQIESSVVGVCDSFQGIAERARSTVSRTADFLSSKDNGASSKQSFATLIQNCSATLVKILNTTEEAGEVSRRAIDRIDQMDHASQMIGSALVKLEQIAHENKMLAMNARIEAAHAGIHGAGFAVVAVEVVSQTERAQEVTAQVGGLIANLRALAGSTLEDLRRMNEQDSKRLEKCRHEVDDSLRDMQDAHGEMEQMLTGMTDEGALLANDIGAAVRGLQFQDRTGQQIAHVVEDLDTLYAKLTARVGSAGEWEAASNEGFSAYTMLEERQVAGIAITESAGGEIDLF